MTKMRAILTRMQTASGMTNESFTGKDSDRFSILTSEIRTCSTPNVAPGQHCAPDLEASLEVSSTYAFTLMTQLKYGLQIQRSHSRSRQTNSFLAIDCRYGCRNCSRNDMLLDAISATAVISTAFLDRRVSLSFVCSRRSSSKPHHHSSPDPTIRYQAQESVSIFEDQWQHNTRLDVIPHRADMGCIWRMFRITLTRTVLPLLEFVTGPSRLPAPT